MESRLKRKNLQKAFLFQTFNSWRFNNEENNEDSEVEVQPCSSRKNGISNHIITFFFFPSLLIDHLLADTERGFIEILLISNKRKKKHLFWSMTVNNLTLTLTLKTPPSAGEVVPCWNFAIFLTPQLEDTKTKLPDRQEGWTLVSEVSFKDIYVSALNELQLTDVSAAPNKTRCSQFLSNVTDVQRSSGNISSLVHVYVHGVWSEPSCASRIKRARRFVCFSQFLCF